MQLSAVLTKTKTPEQGKFPDVFVVTKNNILSQTLMFPSGFGAWTLTRAQIENKFNLNKHKVAT